MSLQEPLRRTLPADIAQVGRQMLSADNFFRQIGDRFDELFPLDSEFEELYLPTGRGAISPVLLAGVTVFQMMEKLPDRLAAEYVASRLDWKYALHLPLSYPGFHFTDLYAFRQRLLAHGWERKILEQLLERLKGLGLLRGRGKMRTDSTHILGLVEWLSQLEVVLESIRLALRAVHEVAPQWVANHLPAAFGEVYSERISTYGWSEAELGRGWQQAGQDGFWLLGQIDHSAPQPAQQRAEVAVLRQVLAQQYPQGPHQSPPAKRPSGKTILQSPHEVQARQGVKRHKVWLGYKAQVTETCDPDLPHLVVDLEPDNALQEDCLALPAIQARLAERDLLPAEQYGDQAYITGALIARSLRQAICLLGPCPRDTTGPPGFRQEDFHWDLEKRQVTCPAGQVSRVWSQKRAAAGEAPSLKLRFHGPTCQACRFFGKCTRSPQGRSLELHPYRRLLELYRQMEQSAAFQRAIQLRAGIEATVSELTRKYGLRRARYRGEAKLRLQAAFTAVALNLNRVIRWWRRAEAVS